MILILKGWFVFQNLINPRCFYLDRNYKIKLRKSTFDEKFTFINVLNLNYNNWKQQIKIYTVGTIKMCFS